MDMKPEDGTKAGKLAENVHKAGIMAGRWRLVKTLQLSVLIVVFAVVCYFMLEIPWFICGPMVIVAAAILALEIIRLKNISRVNTEPQPEEQEQDIFIEPDEVLVDIIPAVMQYGKTRSVEVLGTGKVLTPENALLITNKAVWALTVPLAGADKTVSGADIGKWQWMYAYQDIINGLNLMVLTLPLKDVLATGKAKRLMKLDEIKKASTLPFTYSISFTRSDGQKFGYSIRLENDYLRAKKIFNIV